MRLCVLRVYVRVLLLLHCLHTARAHVHRGRRTLARLAPTRKLHDSTALSAATPPPLYGLTQGPHMSGWNSRHTAARIHLLGFSPSAMRIGAWKVNVGPRMVVE